MLGACAAVLAGTAFACTNLATLNLSTSMGKPGDAVTVTGTGFLANANEMPMDGMVMDMGPGGSGMGDLPTRSPVVLHWNGSDGPVLSEAVPDRSGTISVVFDIPEATAGHYTVVAVQKNPQGFDVYGTPARATIQVVGAGRPAADAARGSGSLAGDGQGTSIGLLALTVGLGVSSVGLVGAGTLAAARVLRARRRVPATVDRD
ncbi:MAG TPA: hypothetical protein VHF27_07130 [Acidimicrobiales bacterium]|nr:hypothetical protein [Acidimicrobiales bacterium]